MNTTNAIEEAISVCDGRVTELARRLGVTHQAIRKWQRERVPAERCIEIERLTEGQVTRHDLRPDLWPAASEAAA